MIQTIRIISVQTSTRNADVCCKKFVRSEAGGESQCVPVLCAGTHLGGSTQSEPHRVAAPEVPNCEDRKSDNETSEKKSEADPRHSARSVAPVT